MLFILFKKLEIIINIAEFFFKFIIKYYLFSLVKNFVYLFYK